MIQTKKELDILKVLCKYVIVLLFLLLLLTTFSRFDL